MTEKDDLQEDEYAEMMASIDDINSYDVESIPEEARGRILRPQATEEATEPAEVAEEPPPAPYKEIVIDRNDQPRQAGASQAEGPFVSRLRKAAEQDLYVFSKAVIGRYYLTKDLHRPVCQHIQKTPPFRKMYLLPREHAKTSIVAHCLPAHIIIQPKDANIYFPGNSGAENRILLSGETATMASKNLRVIEGIFENNKLFRALWPEVCWERYPPLTEYGKKVPWSGDEMIVPRVENWPDPTVKAVGVGGAITGSRPTVLIKDDLVTLAAANSEVEMQTAIEWHIASRALMEEYEKETSLESLEFIVGTRWAVFDLYQYIIDNDPTVDPVIRSIIEDGQPIWPQRFDEPKIEQLKREFGVLFYLMYMNSSSNPELTDFNTELLRKYEWKETPEGVAIAFEADAKDDFLREKVEKGDIDMEQIVPRGRKLDSASFNLIFGRDNGRGEFMRMRYS